ncbi:MAG: DUF1573 domain-containing protein [Desulforhabdus sp.]|jgi:hypothetical protein|nr:DUF1573 domain-containing protein [Desulforhabdus sp.]
MSRPFALLFSLFLIWAWLSSGQAVRAAESPQSASAQVSEESPVINFPEATYDFGEIMEGGEVAHDFIVKNTGKAPLEINQVRPG